MVWGQIYKDTLLFYLCFNTSLCVNVCRIFKSKILQTVNASKVPSWYCVGDRKLSVLHTRLRNKCSDLNFELFTNHVKIAHHVYVVIQWKMLNISSFSVQQIHPLNLNIILFGSCQPTNEVNTHIFVCTQEFIKNSKRFDRTSWAALVLFSANTFYPQPVRIYCLGNGRI